jgi:hypothetical protein
VNTLDAALHWLSCGVALVPLQPNTKYHVAGFGAYLKKITDTEQARYWFSERRCNMGVICAGDLVCLDFDDKPSYAVLGAGLDTLTEQTRRGYHVFVWCAGVAGGKVSGCEVKAGRAVVTVAPSVVSGFRYAVVKPLPIEKIDLRASLPSLSLLSESQKPMISSQDGSGLVDQCKRSLDILTLAQELQAARGLPALRERRGRPEWWRGLCPFHAEKRPSYFVNTERGFYLCRSCGARGDALNLYQVLHGLPDVPSAIRAVARSLSVWTGTLDP